MEWRKRKCTSNRRKAEKKKKNERAYSVSGDDGETFRQRKEWRSAARGLFREREINAKCNRADCVVSRSAVCVPLCGALGRGGSGDEEERVAGSAAESTLGETDEGSLLLSRFVWSPSDEGCSPRRYRHLCKHLFIRQ